MTEAYHAANNYLVVRLQLHGDSHDELPIFYEAADEIKRLQEERKKIIAERDEARREVCQMVSNNDESSKPESAEQVAERRGWDCFKENT